MSNDNYVKLGAICEFINGDRGKNYPSGNDFVNEGVPFINAGHLQNNKIDFKNMNYISKDKFEILGSGKIKKSDILYCLRGSLGKNAVVDVDEGAIASSLLILRTKENIVSANYLIKYINSKQIYEQMIKVNNGSSQPNLSAASVKEFKIYLPNYEIQKKISDILEKSQSLIDKRKDQLECLDELIKSVFYNMFGDPVSNPKKWRIVSLDDVVECVKGITYKPSDVGDIGHIVLRSGNIQDGQLDLSDLVRVKKKINDKFWVQQNDILMCNRNGSARLVGKVAKICDSDEKMTFGTFMTIIRSSYYQYLYAYFGTDSFRNQIQMQTTVAINQISLPLLKCVQLPLPPIELQSKFATIVENIEKQKELIQQSLTQLENNFNVIMQKAFNGELFIK